MKAKTTIDERIRTKKLQINALEEQIKKNQQKAIKANEIIAKNTASIAKKESQILRLEAKKARQQKDAVIGDALVGSGIITEQQNQEIQGLPVPEKKANPPIYSPEV